MISCRTAIEMIEVGKTSDALDHHIEHCAGCGARRALWLLLGEARAVAPSPEFTERLLEALRAASAGARRRAGRRKGIRPLDDFADFPPGSLGQILFGKLQGG